MLGFSSHLEPPEDGHLLQRGGRSLPEVLLPPLEARKANPTQTIGHTFWRRVARCQDIVTGKQEAWVLPGGVLASYTTCGANMGPGAPHLLSESPSRLDTLAGGAGQLPATHPHCHRPVSSLAPV